MTVTDEDLGSRYLAAVAAIERGEIEHARRELEVILLDAPRFAPAWDGLGSCHDVEGELEQAGQCFKKAIRLDRGNWRSRYNWGAALHRAGELRQACRWLRDAARLAPDRRLILRRLGLCYFDLGEYEEALHWYRRALEQPERDVSDAELYVQIGGAEAEIENFEAAEQAYERACLISPNDPVIFFNWAMLAARRGEKEDAERLAQRARALDPKSIRYRLLLLNLALDGGRWEAVETHLRELDELPHSERLRQALRAELARRRGRPADARALAVATLKMDGSPSDHAVDCALRTLRHLRAQPARCQGFRLLVEATSGGQSYFRPYVVLAENEEQARWFVAEIQDALDPAPWQIAETERFPHDEEELAGVYQVLLTRVFFPASPGVSGEPTVQYEV